MPTTRFTEKQWKKLVAVMASGFAMDKERHEALESNAVAKLVAALPFLAGCREPERSAVAHLAVFVLAGTRGAARSIFDPKTTDDFDTLARLSTIADFEGGDPAILNRGMKLLALTMVCGYRNDVAKDRAANDYNPVGSGAWEAPRLAAVLKAEIEASPSAEMDRILSVEAALRGFWEP